MNLHEINEIQLKVQRPWPLTRDKNVTMIIALKVICGEGRSHLYIHKSNYVKSITK